MKAICVACIAVVAAIGLGAAGQPSEDLADHAPVEQRHAANEKAQEHDGASVAIATPKGSGQGSADQNEAHDRTSQVEQSDLKAQWIMAICAGLQLALTAFGLLYIRNTLRANNLAVQEAQRGNEVAAAMVIASQEQFFTERRPWMAQRTLEPVVPHDNFEFAFKTHFENVGASPAFDVAVIFDMDVDDYSFTPIEESYSQFIQSRMRSHKGGEVVFPGDDHIVTHHLQFSLRQLRERDAAWAKREIEKPGLTARVFYAVLYRSPVEGVDGLKTIHHTGGFFNLTDWKGPILVGAPNLPENVSMIARRTTADFLVS
ncbi:hypothetical protein [Brevundimonas vesicularis]|uniref:hypothetical protein n=1 Tax=Brevundimonas vesicularis TaxID=41276 RepID=UPI00384ECE04